MSDPLVEFFMEPFDQFQVMLDGTVYILTRDQLKLAYRSPDWRKTVVTLGAEDGTDDSQPEQGLTVWGGYANDDSIYKIKDRTLDPEEELAIMAREDKSGKSEFFGPGGAYPWKIR